MPEALALGVKHFEGLHEKPIVAGFPHLFMADAVGVEKFGPRAVVAEFVGPGEGCFHDVPVAGVAPCGGQTVHIGLKNRARFEQQRKVADIDRRHYDASARDYFDELISLKSLQCFSNRGSPDAELLLEIVLTYHAPGGQFDAHDEPLDGLVGDG
jgi:hypothetical protein